MNDIISEIYFFGSLADGFKVYPQSNLSFTRYSVFHNNTERNYKLQITKNGELITYTFVRYGLLTALVNGRTGSCFGLSIIFKGRYFNDVNIFISKICLQIFDAIIKERILLARDERNKVVGFVPFDLVSVSDRLEEWKKIIENVVYEKYSSYLSAIHELKDFTASEIDCLNDSSPNKVIIEKLKKKGGVLLGPDYSLIQLTEDEKSRQDSVTLEKKFQILQAEFDSQKNELAQLKLEISECKINVNTLHQKLEGRSEKVGEKSWRNIFDSSQNEERQPKGEGMNSDEGLTAKSDKKKANYPHFIPRRFKKWAPLIWGILIVVVIAIFLLLLN